MAFVLGGGSVELPVQNIVLALGSLPWGAAAAESETLKLSASGEKARVCLCCLGS